MTEITDPRIASAQELLAEYLGGGSEAAFRELVSRYLDLVYSAACRLVDGDRHLAEDVAQTVFADLARKARSLGPSVMLGGWLHRHTYFVASTLMRSERRRQLRERLVAEMNSPDDHSTENLAALTPVLDDAINALGAEDRAAILLRFFEQRDFRGVGQVLGTNEDTARKRVARALERLSGLLQQRGVVLSGAALTAALPAAAVSAAPAGLAATISTSVLASAAAGTGASVTFMSLISMTKVQIATASGILLAIVIPLAIEHQTKEELQSENATLRQTAGEFDSLMAENRRLAGLGAAVASTTTPNALTPAEVLRLRGQVGVLQGRLASATRSVGRSALTVNPEMLKLIREQELAGMKSIYQGLANQAKLSETQLEQLCEVLVDDILEMLDVVAAGLNGGRTTEQLGRILQEREAALLARIETAFGQEFVPQFRNFTRDLSSYLTVQEFTEQLKGEGAAAKASALSRVMQEETRQAVASRQLRPDFQIVPKLNFLNFVSEAEAEKNLQLLEEIFARTTQRAATFLTAEELEAFKELTAGVLKNNASGLALNRAMMAPLPESTR